MNSQKTILVVEDETSIRQIVASRLRKDGYSVIDAVDPHAAIAIAGEKLFQINVLIADIDMPNMKGSDFARELIAMNESLKVIFATGSNYEGMERDLSRIPHQLLAKPYGMESLRDAVVRSLC